LSTNIACAGCGAERSRDDLNRLEVAPGVIVRVCRWRGSTLNDCARKARQGRCAGCGKSSTGTDRALPSFIPDLAEAATVMCRTCRTALAKGNAELAKPPEEARKFAHIDTRRLFGMHLNNVSEEQQLRIAQGLARLAGGRTERFVGEASNTFGHVPPYNNTEGFVRPRQDVSVEVTQAQYETLCELAGLLVAYGDATARAGFVEGENLLGKLASGAVGIATYDDIAARSRPR